MKKYKTKGDVREYLIGLGSSGGNARSLILTKEERVAIATKAVRAREAKRKLAVSR